MDYDPDNVFARILRGEIPAAPVYEDDQVLAFRDVAPQAPIHVLVIPKRAVPRLMEADDPQLLGALLAAVRRIAAAMGFAEDGFRVVINDGARAGQSVFHLHAHVLAGRDLRWPPG